MCGGKRFVASPLALTLFGSYNRWICGSGLRPHPNTLATFLLADAIIVPMMGEGTSHTLRTLGEINHRKQKMKKVIKWKYGQR